MPDSPGARCVEDGLSALETESGSRATRSPSGNRTRATRLRASRSATNLWDLNGRVQAGVDVSSPL